MARPTRRLLRRRSIVFAIAGAVIAGLLTTGQASRLFGSHQDGPDRTAPVEVRRVRTLIVTDEGTTITAVALDDVNAIHDYSVAGAWWRGFDGTWHRPLPSHPPDCTPPGSRGAVLDLGVVRPEKRRDAVTGDPFVVWLRCITEPSQRNTPQPGDAGSAI